MKANQMKQPKKELCTEVIMIKCTKKFKAMCENNKAKLGLASNGNKSIGNFIKKSVAIIAVEKLGIPREYVESIS